MYLLGWCINQEFFQFVVFYQVLVVCWMFFVEFFDGLCFGEYYYVGWWQFVWMEVVVEEVYCEEEDGGEEGFFIMDQGCDVEDLVWYDVCGDMWESQYQVVLVDYIDILEDGLVVEFFEVGLVIELWFWIFVEELFEYVDVIGQIFLVWNQ